MILQVIISIVTLLALAILFAVLFIRWGTWWGATEEECEKVEVSARDTRSSKDDQFPLPIPLEGCHPDQSHHSLDPNAFQIKRPRVIAVSDASLRRPRNSCFISGEAAILNTYSVPEVDGCRSTASKPDPPSP